MEDYEYFKKGYDRIWQNFKFSFKVYRLNVIYQRRLCVEILEELDKLHKDYLRFYGVSTFGLYRYYSGMVEKNYEQIKG